MNQQYFTILLTLFDLLLNVFVENWLANNNLRTIFLAVSLPQMDAVQAQNSHGFILKSE